MWQSLISPEPLLLRLVYIVSKSDNILSCNIIAIENIGSENMELTELEGKVLVDLAEKGPLSGYDFHLGGKRERAGRKALMASSHWLKVKESLSDKNLIVLTTTKGRGSLSSDERGRRKDVYWLTEDGALTALTLGASPSLLARYTKYSVNRERIDRWVKICKLIGPERTRALKILVMSRDLSPSVEKILLRKVPQMMAESNWDLNTVKELFKIMVEDPEWRNWAKTAYKGLKDFFGDVLEEKSEQKE